MKYKTTPYRSQSRISIIYSSQINGNVEMQRGGNQWFPPRCIIILFVFFGYPT